MADERIQYPGWEIVRELGAGSYGKVFEVKKEDSFGETENSALKHIRIPPETVSLQSYSDEMGLDEQSLSAMFRKQMENIANEFSLMSKLKGNSYIVSYEDHSVIPHENGMGYDIYIRMELLKPLTTLLREKYGNGEIDEALVVKLGQDMCRALDLCEKNSIIHRDIKPQNIFLSRQGNFKLGDFGIAKSADHSTIGTRTGTFNYMAPEVYASKPYDHTVDLYSLGMVLYWMLNDRRGPFLPLPPAVPTAEASSEAVGRRMNGEPIPAPKYGSEGLKRIVLKAVSFYPAARYQTAQEMLRDLLRLGQSNGTEFAAEYPGFSEKETSVVAPPMSPETKDTLKPKMAKIPDGPAQKEAKETKPKKKKKWWLIPVIIGGALLLIVALGLIVPAIYNAATERKEREEAASKAEAEKELVKSIPVEVLNSIWQVKYASTAARNEYMKQVFNDVECELHTYPDGFGMVSKIEGAADLLALIFSDRYNETYQFYAEYVYNDGVLKLIPPVTHYPIEDSCPLSEPVTYYLASFKSTGGKLKLSTIEADSNSSYVEYENAYNSLTMRKLEGSASDPDHCYRELLSLNLEFQPMDSNEVTNVRKCEILFTDGGYAVDPEIDTYYDSISILYLKWNSRMISYNGRLQDDGKKGTMSSVKIINCYPNGFIILDEAANEYYVYQEPAKSLED